MVSIKKVTVLYSDDLESLNLIINLFDSVIIS